MMRMVPGELQIFGHWRWDQVLSPLSPFVTQFLHAFHCPTTIKQRMKCQSQLDSRILLWHTLAAAGSPQQQSLCQLSAHKRVA